jgi:hypothetical protein
MLCYVLVLWHVPHSVVIPTCHVVDDKTLLPDDTCTYIAGVTAIASLAPPPLLLLLHLFVRADAAA